MDSIDYKDIASRYGVADDDATDMFNQWMTTEDPNVGESNPDESFDIYVKNTLEREAPSASFSSETSNGGGGDKDCNMSFYGYDPDTITDQQPSLSSTQRTLVEFVPVLPDVEESVGSRQQQQRQQEADFGAPAAEDFVDPLDDGFVESSLTSNDNEGVDPKLSEDYHSVYSVSSASFGREEEEEEEEDIGSSFRSPLEDAFRDPSTTMVSQATFDGFYQRETDGGSHYDNEYGEDNLYSGAKTTSALDSWDDLLDAVEDIDGGPSSATTTPSSAYSSTSTMTTIMGRKELEHAISDQQQLRKLLVSEGKRINHAIAPGKIVLAIVPSKSMSTKTLNRIRGSKDEKTAFVLSHLLVQAGTQPQEQLTDRPYRSLDNTEYTWPSSGKRRLVRNGNIPFHFGDVDAAINTPHGKNLKPIYLECDKVLG